MKKFLLTNAAALVIWLLPLVYLIWIYHLLPAIVPIHYNAKGITNGYGSRGTFIMLQAFMSVMSIGTYLLVRYIPSIDPKKAAQYSAETFGKISLGLMLFLSAISISITYAALNHSEFNVTKLLFPLMGLLFAFLGNMMNNIKPNYFVGVRTPWTLEDEATWKATHRLTAKLWFIGGLVITIISLMFSHETLSVFFPAAIIGLAIIPIAYSYVYYKKHTGNK
jgi:uncharacterized membrane protein